MKLHELDTWLALPYEAQVKLNNQDETFVREVARYYGSYLEDSMFYTSTEIKRNNVTVILNSKPKQLAQSNAEPFGVWANRVYKMETNINEVEINGTKYVRKDSVKTSELANQVNGLKLVMIRTYSAGIHYGYLKSREGKEAILLNSTRVWYWSGAASLSQLATDGTTKPNDCKLSVEVPEIILTESIEIIPMTEKAINNLNSVKKWKV